MQKLHLVGITTERDALILSARRGARSGSFQLPVDAKLAEAVAEAMARQEASEDAAEPTAEAPARTESALSVREIQARLRQGRTVAEVAAAAGVDDAWVERFAPPVLAERSQLVATALAAHLQRSRLGRSVAPLGDAVRRHLAERGIRMTAQELGEAWTAHQGGDDRWVLQLAYRSRGSTRTLRYDFDPRTGTLTTDDRSSAQAGFVAPTSDDARPASTARSPRSTRSPSAAAPTSEQPPAKAPSRLAKERARAAAAMERSVAKQAAAGRAASRRTRSSSAPRDASEPVDTEAAPRRRARPTDVVGPEAKAPARKRAAKVSERATPASTTRAASTTKRAARTAAPAPKGATKAAASKGAAKAAASKGGAPATQRGANTSSRPPKRTAGTTTRTARSAEPPTKAAAPSSPEPAPRPVAAPSGRRPAAVEAAAHQATPPAPRSSRALPSEATPRPRTGPQGRPPTPPAASPRQRSSSADERPPSVAVPGSASSPPSPERPSPAPPARPDRIRAIPGATLEPARPSRSVFADVEPGFEHGAAPVSTGAARPAPTGAEPVEAPRRPQFRRGLVEPADVDGAPHGSTRQSSTNGTGERPPRPRRTRPLRAT